MGAMGVITAAIRENLCQVAYTARKDMATHGERTCNLAKLRGAQRTALPMLQHNAWPIQCPRF